MLVSAQKPGGGKGIRGQTGTGPAAVRGDAPAPTCHWPSGWEGGEGGSPESEDLRLPGEAEPLAEGGFVYFRVVLLVASVAALFVVPPVGAAVPHRIVSLSPTATESLFAIRAGKQVVAVDDQSDYPKRAPRTSLSGYTPNVEAIAGYRPDLVVLSGDANDVVAGLKKLGIRVLLQPAAKNLPEAYAQIKQLGTLTGHKGGAASVVAHMRKVIAQTL